MSEAPQRLKPRRRAALIAAGITVGLGLDLLTFSSTALSLTGTVFGLAGIVALAYVVLSGFGAPEGSRSRGRELGATVTSTVVSLLVVVGLAAALRLGPRKFALDHQRFDADLGWGPDDAGGTFGQRAQHADPNREHFVIVGDSILYGQGVGLDETAVHLLETRYQGSRFQPVNLSVSGWSIDQYWLTLKHELPRLHPRLIVVGVYAGNDFQITSRDYGWGHTKPYYELEGDRLVRRNPDLLADNCIDHLAQSLLFRLVWIRKEFALDLIDDFCHPHELPTWQAEAVIAKEFDEIEALGRARQIPVLFMLLPDRMDIPGAMFDERHANLRSKYGTLLRLLRDGHHDVYEHAASLAQQNDKLDGLFRDPGHYTPAGHRFLAQSLERELVRRYGFTP